MTKQILTIELELEGKAIQSVLVKGKRMPCFTERYPQRGDMYWALPLDVEGYDKDSVPIYLMQVRNE